jgi:uncharacterized OsmC-like protein
MEAQHIIRTAMERNARAIELRPSLAQGTAVTRVRVLNGLTCEIEEGRFRLVADMHTKHGGGDEGPNPGVYGRAALGSCLAIGYMMFASRMGVEIDALEVEVQADWDSRAELGISDQQSGYEQVRYIVTVESPAPEDEVMKVLDETDAHSPYLAVFQKPLDVRREVRLRARGAAAEPVGG